MKDWRRTASRLLADSEVLALLEKEQDKLLKREQSKSMTRADVIAELREMLEVASDRPSRAGWSARLKVLEVLARVLPEREETAPEPNPQPSEAETQAKIAQLEESLGLAKPISEENSEKLAPVEAPNTAEHQQTTADAPERRQTPATALAAVEDMGKLNVPPAQSPDEKEQQCCRHEITYLATRNRSGHWSFCPECLREWGDNERYLSSLLPAGDYRQDNRWK